jgi:uncharacterized protein YndB with AHSA1/START domain
MPRGGGSIWIDAAPERVFEFVSDVENNPRWRSYVVDAQWLDDGPMRIGRRGRQTSSVLGRRWSVEAEVVEWEPPRRVVWATTAGDAAVRTACEVAPEGGGSRLSMWTEGAFTNPILRVLSPILIATMKRQATSDGRKLSQALASIRQPD